MGILLHIIAKILLFALTPIGILYSLFRNINVNAYFRNTAISIDILGNVVLQNILNDLLIKKDAYLFGNKKQTISYVIALNFNLKKLTFVGRIMANMLEFFDKGHLQKSIQQHTNN